MEPERLDTTHATQERRLIEEAQRDICEAFPWLPAERVSVVVECIWATYDDARIRDFIPVLVRKQAREVLHGRNQNGLRAAVSHLGGGPEVVGDTGFEPVHNDLPSEPQFADLAR